MTCKYISAEMSKRIISLRFLLIFFVICIHSNLKVDVALNYYHYDFQQPYWIEFVKKIVCNTFGGAAVPLFFFFASFLQFSKNDKYDVLLKKRMKSIVFPYILWTVITIVLYFIIQTIPNFVDFFTNTADVVKTWGGREYLKAFTFRDDMAPLVYQFWFLRDLIIFIIFSPVIKFICEKLRLMILLFVLMLVLKGVSFHFVSSQGLLFYMAGYFCAHYKIDFFKIADSVKLYSYGLVYVFIVMSHFFFKGKLISVFFEILISCFFFFKLSGYFIKNNNLFQKLNYLSAFSFFVYACHAPLISSSVNKITQKIIPLHGLYCLLQFFIAVALTTFLTTTIAILTRKFFPSIFKLLNGGR